MAEPRGISRDHWDSRRSRRVQRVGAGGPGRHERDRPSCGHESRQDRGRRVQRLGLRRRRREQGARLLRRPWHEPAGHRDRIGRVRAGDRSSGGQPPHVRDALPRRGRGALAAHGRAALLVWRHGSRPQRGRVQSRHREGVRGSRGAAERRGLRRGGQLLHHLERVHRRQAARRGDRSIGQQGLRADPPRQRARRHRRGDRHAPEPDPRARGQPVRRRGRQHPPPCLRRGEPRQPDRRRQLRTDRAGTVLPDEPHRRPRAGIHRGRRGAEHGLRGHPQLPATRRGHKRHRAEPDLLGVQPGQAGGQPGVALRLRGGLAGLGPQARRGCAPTTSPTRSRPTAPAGGIAWARGPAPP
jgi:hypothetical protein